MWTLLWWQFGCKDEWASEFTDKFGWFVNIKSMQEELFVWIWIGSFINWEKPSENVDEYKCDPSVVFMSIHHYEENLALKSPVTTDKDGLRLFMSLKGSPNWIKTIQIDYYFDMGNDKSQIL